MGSLTKLIGNYKFNSVFMRNFIIITLLLILPLGGFSVFMHFSNRSIVEGEIAQASLSSLSRIKDTVDMVFSEINGVSIRLNADPFVQAILNSRSSTPYEAGTLLSLRELQDTVRLSELTITFIESIYLYFEHQQYFLNSIEGRKITDLEKEWWYENYESHSYEDRTWFHSFTEHGYITQYRRLSDLSAGSEGVLIINLDANRLETLITNTVQPQAVFIVDEEGKVLFNPIKEFTGAKFQSIEPEVYEYWEQGDYSQVIRMDEQERVISIVNSDYRNWKYVSITPLTEYQEKIAESNKISIIFLLFSIVSAVVLAIIISVKNYEPILRIIKLIENRDDDLFLQKKYHPSRLDEVKFIASTIIQTHHERDELFDQLSEKYAQLRKAQAVALQSQINPHFLFNTLETINWRAVDLMDGDNEISDMIRSLSKLLRYSLDTEEEFILIEKEMEFVRIYSAIQKMRYKEKISIQWQFADDVQKYRILKLLVQPIVENAIYHGIKPSSTPGVITISGYCQADTVVIKVRDNGIGMKKAVVEKLNADFYREEMKENEHIGLANVNQRIQLMFGRKYGLRIQSEWKQGTIVVITFPKVE